MDKRDFILIESVVADGTCIIDVELTDPVSDETDRASLYDVQTAAFNIIGLCVRYHGHGGKSVGVGE